MRVLMIVVMVFSCLVITACSVIAQSSETDNGASCDESPSLVNENKINSLDSPLPESDFWEQSICVHESLPEFILQLCGDGGVFTDLSIVDPSGQAMLVYKFDIDNAWGIRKDLFSVEIQDMDFDGYQDIAIFTGYGRNWKKDYIYIMWSSDEANFVGDIYGLSNLGLPTFDADTKLVHSMQRASAGDHWSYKHQYIDGELVTKEEVADNLVWDLSKDEITQKQIAALEPLYNEEFSNFVLYQKKQLNTDSGEMVVVDRKYILYHKLDYDKTMEYSPDSEIGMLLEQYEINSEP